MYTIHNQGDDSKASGKVLPGQAEKQTALDGTETTKLTYILENTEEEK